MRRDAVALTAALLLVTAVLFDVGAASSPSPGPKGVAPFQGTEGTEGPGGNHSSSSSSSAENLLPTGPDVLQWQGYVFIGIVFGVFVGLLLGIAPMFAILGLSALILYLCGIIDGNDLFSGLVNNGVLSIAMLYVVVHPIIALPAMKVLVKLILGKVPDASDHAAKRALNTRRAGRLARFKLCLLCLITSPFLENTPQCAMFTPLVTQHCREIGMAPSQVLMPMSVSILLGNTALLGASSNVIIAGMMHDHNWGDFPFFELAKVNVLVALPVLLYCVFMPPYLLPQRRGGSTFYVNIKIGEGSPLVGMTVGTLLQLFLKKRKDDVDRIVVVKARSERKLVEPFSRLTTLRVGDELVVAGLVDTLLECLESKHAPSALWNRRSAAADTSMRVFVDAEADGGSEKLSARERRSTAAHSQDVPTAVQPLATLESLTRNSGHVGFSTFDTPGRAVTSIGAFELYLKDLIDSLFFQTPSHIFCVGPTSPQQTLRRGMSSAGLAESFMKDTLRNRKSRGTRASFGGSFAAMDADETLLAQKHILMFCAELRVTLVALKVSKEGADLLQDKVAFAMAPTASTVAGPPSVTAEDSLTSPGRGRMEPMSPGTPMLGRTIVVLTGEGGGHREDDASESGTPQGQGQGQAQAPGESLDEEALLVARLTFAEWHRQMGGKLFTIHLPSWFPFGSLQTEKDDSDDEADDGHDHGHGHGSAPPSSGKNQKTKPPPAARPTSASRASRRVIRLPWCYQYISLLVFLGIVVASVLDVPLKISSMVSCVAVVLLQLITSKELARTLPVEIYLLVGFCFPLGIGMQKSGLAKVFGDMLASVQITGYPLYLLIGAVTLVMTNTITNQGSVQVILPLVVHVFHKANLEPLPGIVMVATMLCCCVCTPFAIPCNAIIAGPGGYRAKDYMVFGLPLALIVLATAALLVCLVYDSW